MEFYWVSQIFGSHSPGLEIMVDYILRQKEKLTTVTNGECD